MSTFLYSSLDASCLSSSSARQVQVYSRSKPTCCVSQHTESPRSVAWLVYGRQALAELFCGAPFVARIAEAAAEECVLPPGWAQQMCALQG
jgi:hypothetical protein